MEPVLDFLKTPQATVYIVMGILFVYGLFRNRLKKYDPMILKAFNWTEKLIKDGQGGALGKLDQYLKEFSKQHKDKYGKEPSEKVLAHAKEKVEVLVNARNN